MFWFVCFVCMWSCYFVLILFFFFKQKTAYEMRISDWSSDVCSSDLTTGDAARLAHILAGLRAFQAAARPPAPPDVPVVASAGRARLLDFGGKGPAAVFVPSLINSSRILDLAEDNSMLRWLSGEGIRPLLVDWRTPDPAEHALDLGGHITDLLHPILRELGAPYHLPGHCLGGTM